MFGKLQKIEITEKLAWKYAKADFAQLSDGDNLCDESGCTKTDWLVASYKDLEDFNYVVDLLDTLKVQCEVRVYCRDDFITTEED